MLSAALLLPFTMAAAELGGAGIYAVTRNSWHRALLACFGLGFALLIVAADIVPDALAASPHAWPWLPLGAAIAAVLMFKAGARGSSIGTAGAVAGMGLHNICEGIVLAAAWPAASPLLIAGAVVHKLPEGMVVFALLDRLPAKRRWAVASALAVLIPAGTLVPAAAAIQAPLLSFAAGVLVVVLAKALLAMAGTVPATQSRARASTAAATLAGGVVAGVSCLIV